MSSSGDHDIKDLNILKNEANEVIASIEQLKTASRTKENIQLMKLETNELTSIMERYRDCVYACNGNLDPNVEEDKQTSDEIWNEYKTFNRASKIAITQGQVIVNEFFATQNKESIPNLFEPQPTTSYRPKLPDIKVPTFDGTLTEFPEFKSQFESIIHNNDAIPKAGKMHYLKQALIKEAAQTLKDMPETAEIYDEAWALVLQNYENYKAIIRQHLDNLFAIPRIESKAEISNLLLKVRRIMKGIKVCGENPENWSVLISYMVSERLDKKTYEDFENTLETKLKFPPWEQLENFLKIREGTVPRTSDLKPRKPSVKENENPKRKFAATTVNDQSKEQSKSSCVCCNQSHLLIYCPEFNKKEVNDRFQLLKEKRLCFNCFNPHRQPCKKPPNCKLCHRSHHSMLHRGEAKPNQVNTSITSESNKATKNSESESNQESGVKNNFTGTISTRHSVILPSALVKFKCSNVMNDVRVLLDSCAQGSLITESFVKCYNLPVTKSAFVNSVVGIGGSKLSSNLTVNLCLISRVSNFTINVTATVITVPISYHLNSIPLTDYSKQLSEFVLADPEFYKPSATIFEIYLLIGAEYYDRITTDEQRRWIDTICLKSTHFGWTISSTIQDKYVAVAAVEKSNSYCGLVTSTSEEYNVDRLEQQLKAFWETENIPEEATTTSEAELCVKHFDENTTRNSKGEFVVRLPFKGNPNEIVGNYYSALSCLKRNEIRAEENVRLLYVKFMREYSELEHMSRVYDFVPRYFIPHHSVIRQSSTSTPLRVVFNASFRSNNKKSLNDILMVGPTIQPELFDILIKFGSYIVVWTADISKMYRCVWIHPDDRRYQSILWRESPERKVEVNELNTVTYGEATSSFLATKCLETLGKENIKKFPKAAKLILKNFYMDDFLAGAQSTQEAIKLIGQVHSILETAGFILKKYQANRAEVLTSISPEFIETKSTLRIGGQKSLAILGLSWSPTKDVFCVKMNNSFETSKVTKLTMHSDLAKLFDPLGFVTPTTIRGKILMQRVFKLGKSWEEPVDDEIKAEFLYYLKDVMRLSEIPIKRSYGEGKILNLTGFSDASNLAFCAVIYLRFLEDDGSITTSLVCSKTKIAPIIKLTIPQLELQAAELLHRLADRVSKTLSIHTDSIKLYSDSKIVLSWLSKPTKDWKIFVRNRVSKIMSKFPKKFWDYVPSKLNPADLGTRGITVDQLKNSVLWFNGPFFLLKKDLPEGDTPFDERAYEYLAKNKINVNAVIKDEMSYIERKSSYNQLVRTYATVNKIANIWKQKTFKRGDDVVKSAKLSAADIEAGELMLYRIIQRTYYMKEYYRLRDNRKLPKSSPLRSLYPILDNNGIIRTRTRLINAPVPFDQKQPIVLPARCHFTKIWVIHLHLKFLHGSKSVISSYLSSNFQFTGGIQGMIKKIIRYCCTCIRHSRANNDQIMADLPKSRVTPTRAFSVCGVDLSGAFTVKCTAHRTVKYTKAYICLFVCFSTHTVHIELVSALSVEAFLNAFHRFIHRRGLPRVVHSDNGTNFTGTNKYLSYEDPSIQNWAINEKIQWKFNLPGTPHRGGIWEAAIGSAKKFLPKITKDQILTFEELETLLTRVECILNSRPLCYRNINEAEYEVLTPAHLSIGSNLMVLPEPEHVPNVKLSQQYKANIQRMESFWKLWHSDYLNSIRNRSKWAYAKPNLNVDDIVIVTKQTLRPSQWKLGRITKIFPDRRGNVRTVELLSDGKTEEFASTFLIPLPQLSDL